MKKEKSVESDLSLKSEMSVFISNLVNMEEHLDMIIAQTKNKKYIPIRLEIRKLRIKYLKKYFGREIKNQEWCFLKHNLGNAYRATEIAVKNMILGNKDEAIENLQDSKDLFELSFLMVEIGGE